MLLLAVTAAAGLALEPKQRLNCDNPGRDGRLASYCEMREQTLPATGGTIDADGGNNGGISVAGWERSDILVRAQVRTAAPSDGEARDLARQIQVATAGAHIQAHGPDPDRDHHWSVSYEIFVPVQSSVALRTHNGGVSIRDVNGRMEFAAVNGGVALQRVGGDVRGHTVNGGLSIVLEGDRWDGNGMDVSTTNGGVSMLVPANYSAQLETGTVNGGMNMDFPMTVQDRRDRRISTTLGMGGATLRAVTTNGGVSVRRR